MTTHLPGKAKTCGYTAHCSRDQVVQVPVCWVVKLQGPEADIIESLVVNHEGLIRVLNQLVHGEGGIIRFHNGVRDLRRRNHAESAHDPVWVLLAYFRVDQGSQTRPSPPTERVRQLETLDAVAALGFFA